MMNEPKAATEITQNAAASTHAPNQHIEIYHGHPAVSLIALLGKKELCKLLM